MGWSGSDRRSALFQRESRREAVYDLVADRRLQTSKRSPSRNFQTNSLAVLFAVLRSVVRSRAELQLENLALRQINVLRRSLKKRPKLSSGDRPLLGLPLPRLWRDWPSTLAMVKPETVVAWHRKGFRLFWTWKVRRGQPGRPGIAG